MVERLPSMHEALGSSPTVQENKINLGTSNTLKGPFLRTFNTKKKMKL